MTTLVRQSRTEVFRDYLSERELAERWGVSARTVHRRIAGARLSPVGVEDRLPHFHRRDVEAYEAKQSIAARGGQRRILKSHLQRLHRSPQGRTIQNLELFLSCSRAFRCR